MNIEKKHERHTIVAEQKTANSIYGIIYLDKMAKPETVEVEVLGEPLNITQFDEFGQPILTEKQLRLCQYKNNAIDRQTRTPSLLEADVWYEEEAFNKQRSDFDSLAAVKRAVENLRMLDILLHNRSKFHKSFPDERMNEFLLFGHIKLDAFGQVAFADNGAGTPVMIHGLNDVEEFRETFLGTDFNKILYRATNMSLPTPSSFCPICGKRITIDDIKEPNLLCGDCHRDCERLFARMTEEDKLCELIYAVYPDYNFAKTPVKSGSPCMRFCFETIHGHISLDSAEGDDRIRIAWHKDYPTFDTRKVAPRIYMADDCRVVQTNNLDDAITCLLNAKRNILD